MKILEHLSEKEDAPFDFKLLTIFLTKSSGSLYSFVCSISAQECNLSDINLIFINQIFAF